MKSVRLQFSVISFLQSTLLCSNDCVQLHRQSMLSYLQVFSTLFSSADSALVCAPAGSGKTACAELAILHLMNAIEAKQKEAESDDTVIVPPLRAVYVAPMDQIVGATFAEWEVKFGKGGLGLNVVRLTGEQQV